MKSKKFAAAICVLIALLYSDKLLSQSVNENFTEPHRPQIHFTPPANWMNDPNGMVYHNGVYHLFYQHYPDKPVWGPMHWGHAVSKDLIHWQHKPIALYPDSLGYIFSGSVVVDKNNTSGFGKNGKAPLIAIFTHHNMEGEKAKRDDFQYQSIAYSNNDGNTWTKYEGNPVLKSPGIADFRDPKVMWYQPQQKWIMTLAVKDRIMFYSSPNLKDWTKESEFGETAGAHGGVWECPDLFTLDDNGKKTWVLIVSIGRGGPNGGSATQYFLGNFDGNKFSPLDTKTRWIDYGTDNYAGVTWSNTGNRKIFLGWMSNWLYAQTVPTEVWRSAMTIPRELKIKHTGGEIFVASEPVKELSVIQTKKIVVNSIAGKNMNFPLKTNFPCRINFETSPGKSFAFVLKNDDGEETAIGYDKKANQFFIDRTKSGITNFYEGFAAKHTAPRLAADNKIRISLLIDVSSVELFADNGLTVMTDIFFPHKPYNRIHIQSQEKIVLSKVEYTAFKSTWK